MNSIGILISTLIAKSQGVIFFIVLIFLMIIYGKIVGREHYEQVWKFKINREVILISLTIVFGLLHVLGVY
jgi:low affinity Fe/Cu permease